MKKFGFMLMTAAVAVMTITSCGKKNDPDPIVPPTPGGDDEVVLPTVEGTAGAVTLVVKFDQAPCDGYDVLFVGKYDDTSWDFATAHKFEALKDGWYKIVLKPGAEEEGIVINGRPIQGKDGAGEWSNDWSHNGDDLIQHKGASDDMIKDSGYGEINLAFSQAHADDAVVVYLESKKWNVSPCATASEYNLTIKTPAFCEEFEIELIGDFCGWADDQTIKLGKGKTEYTTKVTAMAGTKYKIRGVGSWDKEVVGYVDDPESEAYDTWIGVPDNLFDDNLNPVLDYSDSKKYKWNVCD